MTTEPLLTIAEDLERRDERAAEALLEVEQLQAEVDDMRAHAGAVAAFFRDVPVTEAALEAEERAAGEAHARAAAWLSAAEEELARVQGRGSESARLDAARAA